MTPLEELQAAHKQLSDMRNASSQGPWRITAGRDGRVEIGADQAGWDVIADRDVQCDQLPVLQEDADLIVTLHRTIDAQLSLLDVAYGTLHDDGNRRGTFLVTEALRLARAINGTP